MNQIMNIFTQSKALMSGHFKLSSGKHSDQYLQCAKALQYPEYSRLLGKLLSEKVNSPHPDVVISPALGGIIIGYEVAAHLGVRSIFAERVNGKLTLRRGFSIQRNEKVLIIEDVITTGKSTAEICELIREAAGQITSIGCIADRSGGSTDLPVPVSSLLAMDIQSWNASECPLCKKGIDLIYHGSRFAQP